MAGTFSSFGTALSALRYNQVAMDVASGNIANATTAGYARRRVDAQTVGAPAHEGIWSRADLAGDGVSVKGLTRLTDQLLDTRARREHGNQTYLDVRSAVLQRVETGINEPSDTGVAAAMDDFRAAWRDLGNDDGVAARNQVLVNGAALADALRAQASGLDAEKGDQRARVLTDVTEVNDLAKDLAKVNADLAAAKINGTEDSALQDQRDQIAMRLSNLTGATATLRADNGFDVTIGGVALVTGRDAGQLEIAGGVTPGGAADGNPVSFAVTFGSTSTVSITSGELGAVSDLLNVTLPAYDAGLGAVTAELADAVNTLHQGGFDPAGAAGGAFFTYDPADPARTLTVAITDTAKVAASTAAGGTVQGGNADLLGQRSSAESSYQQLVTGFGSQVASTKRLASTQQLLTTQVDGSRDQLSGVSIDEETVNLMAAQRGYEAAARVMNVMDSVLDTLINRMGIS